MTEQLPPETERATDEPGPRVVTIGWQLPVLFLVGLIVMGAFYFLGSGGLSPTPGGSTSTGPQYTIVANPTAEALAAIVPPDPSYQFNSTEPQALPERYHPLTDTKAPDFQMAKLGGAEKVRLSELAGKSVLVNFWATWCPPCRLEMPWVKNVYEKYKDQGFVVLGVDAGEKVAPEQVEPAVRQYVESQGLTFPILLDPNTYQLQQSWAVSGLPSSYLINPKGTITFVHVGMFPNEATLDSLVQKVLPGGEWADQDPAGAGASVPSGAQPGAVSSQP